MKICAFKDVNKKKLLAASAPHAFCDDKLILSSFPPKKIIEADCFLQFNIYNPYLEYKNPARKQAYEYILSSGKPFLVFEEGAFRQFPDYKRFGWYSYKNGLGDFNDKNVNNSRWLQFKKDTGLEIPPWSSKGENILVIGQLEGDSALIELYDAGYKSFLEYLVEKIYEIRKHTDRHIIVRPHPVDISGFNSILTNLPDVMNVSISNNFSSGGSSLSGGAGLQKDLDKAHCVITYNSNTGVEAVCQGIPIFALSTTSSIYDIAHTAFEDIERLNYNIDITNWCNKIVYSVWNPTEVASGEMWTHFKESYNAKIKK
jgi:capsule polysaccharide modification protein KpsS